MIFLTMDIDNDYQTKANVRSIDQTNLFTFRNRLISFGEKKDEEEEEEKTLIMKSIRLEEECSRSAFLLPEHQRVNLGQKVEQSTRHRLILPRRSLSLIENSSNHLI